MAPQGVSLEWVDYESPETELRLTDSDVYGEEIAAGIRDMSEVELLDQTIDQLVGRDLDEELKFSIPELYAVLGLSIVATGFDIEAQTYNLHWETVLDACEAIHVATSVKESNRAHESQMIVERAQKQRQKGGFKRQAPYRELERYAISLYSPGAHETKAAAIREILPLLREYAHRNNLPKLSEERAEKTVRKWLDKYE